MQTPQPLNPMLNSMPNPMIQPMNPAFNTMGYPPNNQSFNTMPNNMYYPANTNNSYNTQPVNNQPKPAINTFDSFDVAPSKPTQQNQPNTTSNNDIFGFDSLTVKEQPKTHTNDAFDFPALRNPPPSTNTGNSGIAPLQPPPPRTATLKKDDKKPEDSSPSCPICNKKFKANTSNDEINRHVDECLNRGLIEDNGSPKVEAPPKNDTDGEPWKEWFDLSKMEWYYGTIDRQEAEKIMMRCTEDSFMVRKSSVRFLCTFFVQPQETSYNSHSNCSEKWWIFIPG